MIRSLLNLYRYLKEYGFKCTFIFCLCMLFPYSETKNGRWRRQLIQRKYRTLTNYLYRHYYQTSESSQQVVSGQNRYNNCIWTAWLQGEENAPEVIRITLASIRKHANGHPVIVIGNDNVDQYIVIPQTIRQKHESGAMSHAHYSDVIRMMILAQYGGLWLDATMLLHEPISEEAFQCPFYSVGFSKTNGEKYITGNKWLIGVVGGYRNSPYLVTIAKMLSRYWTEHSIAIDYFVFDYFVYILYQADSSFHLIVDNLPKMVHYTYVLRKIINCPYDEKQLKTLYTDKQIYLLSYRGNYIKKTPEGDMTFYGYLYNLFLEKNNGAISSDENI